MPETFPEISEENFRKFSGGRPPPSSSPNFATTFDRKTGKPHDNNFSYPQNAIFRGKNHYLKASGKFQNTLLLIIQKISQK
jgi:hypothetical protein